MVATSLHLELRNIDQMTRQELIAAIGSKRECLRPDLVEGLEEESTDRLQLLLLVARLIQVLRHVRSC
jgi:hypothetical protein